eukprot:scaffold160_cov136-Cylindrotheca_fusiformis.AAC.9
MPIGNEMVATEVGLDGKHNKKLTHCVPLMIALNPSSQSSNVDCSTGDLDQWTKRRNSQQGRSGRPPMESTRSTHSKGQCAERIRARRVSSGG